MAVPRLVKITVNMGLGEALQNPKLLEAAEAELTRDHRPEAGHHQGAEVASPPSSCARARRSAAW